MGLHMHVCSPGNNKHCVEKAHFLFFPPPLSPLARVYEGAWQDESSSYHIKSSMGLFNYLFKMF